MNDYPFELWIMAVVSEGVPDAAGFVSENVSEWVKYADCYEQVLGSSSVVERDNGESFSFSSKIFLPGNTKRIADGTRIQVRQSGEVRFDGISNRFSRDIEHCRIWA